MLIVKPSCSRHNMYLECDDVFKLVCVPLLDLPVLASREEQVGPCYKLHTHHAANNSRTM